VISVSPVSDGPFGQVLRYGAGVGRVNALIHELRATVRQSIHELSTDVDTSWITATSGRSATHREHFDPWQVGGRGGPEVGIAVVADAPDAGNRIAQLVVRRLAPQHGPEIVAVR